MATLSDAFTTLCANIDYHDEGMFRDASFMASGVFSSRVSATQIVKKLGRLAARHPAQAVDIANTVKALCMFLGDNFNNFVGEYTPEDLKREKITLGPEPSPIVLAALQHPDKAFSGGIKYPETLDKAEQLGIISKKNFFAFANLAAKVAQEEQLLGLRLKEADAPADPVERAKIRADMVTSNIEYLIAGLCMTAHIFTPHPEAVNAHAIDMDMLSRCYPGRDGVAKGVILSYSNVACVNRIMREVYGDGRIEQDAVIAIMERKGEYMPALKEQVRAVAERHLSDKNIPASELPPALQSAIAENQARILAGIGKTDKGLLKFLSGILAYTHVRGGASNRIARVKAWDAGNRAGIKNEPRRM